MDEPDPLLIAAVARLDDRACRELLRRYERLIHAAITHAGFFPGDLRDREEMFSDVAYEVIRSIESWRHDRGAFSSWVYGITRNVVNSFRRRHDQRRETGMIGNVVSSGTLGPKFDPPDRLRADASAPPRPSDAEIAFGTVYGTLTEEDQMVVDHMVRCAPHRELAEALNISEPSARMRVYRMKEKLIRLLAAALGIDA